MMRQLELVEKVKAYDPTADEDALNRAYVFAMQAHGSQKRASGDPYFSHPLDHGKGCAPACLLGMLWAHRPSRLFQGSLKARGGMGVAG